MDIKLVHAYVDYIVVDDEERAILTFTFPNMDKNTRVTLIHDRAINDSEPYELSRDAPALMLSAQCNEGIIINVWNGNTVVAGGIFQVETQSDNHVLRSICDSGLQLIQEGKLSSASDEEFEWVCQFAGD
jgi:hypothetical protein